MLSQMVSTTRIRSGIGSWSTSSSVMAFTTIIYHSPPERRLTNQANRLRGDGAQAPPASSPVERVVRRQLISASRRLARCERSAARTHERVSRMELRRQQNNQSVAV